MKLTTSLLLALCAPWVAATAANAPKPLLAVPDKVVFKDDFTKPAPLKKEVWSLRQGTRWTVEDGVLRGRPSGPEYRAKRKDHFGYEPRISAPITPKEFVAEFSVRFNGGTETAISPFIEFGHHVCRIRLSKDGAEMLADHEGTRVAETKDLKYEPGKWYHVLAELKGDEIVVQFTGGPTLYAKHAVFTKPAESGSNGLGIAGAKEGVVEIDNVTLWSVKPQTQPGWESARAALPKFAPVPAKAEQPAKKAAKKAK